TQFAKITSPHGIAGNACSRCAQPCCTGVVIIEEEKGLILEDRAADGTTVVIATERRNRISSPICKPVVRIEACVAKELVPASVTPGASEVRATMLRSIKGRSLMKRRLTTCPVSASSVWMVSAADSTCTV